MPLDRHYLYDAYMMENMGLAVNTHEWDLGSDHWKVSEIIGSVYNGTLEFWLKSGSVSNSCENETQGFRVILLLPKTLVHSNLEYCLLYCPLHLRMDTVELEKEQKLQETDRFLLPKADTIKNVILDQEC